MVQLCKDDNCDEVFDTPQEAAKHKKNLHSALISCRFPSRKDMVITILRDVDGLFRCPGCHLEGKNYIDMYNHCTRVKANDKQHAAQLDQYLQSMNALVSDDATARDSQLCPVGPATYESSQRRVVDALHQASQQVFESCLFLGFI